MNCTFLLTHLLNGGSNLEPVEHFFISDITWTLRSKQPVYLTQAGSIQNGKLVQWHLFEDLARFVILTQWCVNKRDSGD